MNKRNKKILFGTLSGVLIPSAILGIYFGGIAIHDYNTFTKPFLPKEYEKENYEFDSKITKLNEEAQKYFSLNESALKSKQISKSTKEDDVFYFVFNKIHEKCQIKNINQDDYFSVTLKINKDLFNDILMEFIENNDLDGNSFITKNENNIMWYQNNRRLIQKQQSQVFNSDTKQLITEHIFIKNQKPKYMLNLIVDYKNKKSSLEIKNLITEKTIKVEFALEMKRV
ncbi:hypothetical protein [Metamycoplasma gateae]|uniref:Uncharacterized protein n=1 Tax=Metamycoplasma gateae TaxID=35769 RepID=A0ABZ2AHP0_9BACT|nr:hypothetical protein V2E26_00925 [Metamycoplasma gateae]